MKTNTEVQLVCAYKHTYRKPFYSFQCNTKLERNYVNRIWILSVSRIILSKLSSTKFDLWGRRQQTKKIKQKMSYIWPELWRKKSRKNSPAHIYGKSIASAQNGWQIFYSKPLPSQSFDIDMSYYWWAAKNSRSQVLHAFSIFLLFPIQQNVGNKYVKEPGTLFISHQ